MKYFNHSELYDGIKTCGQLHFYFYPNLLLLLSGDISLNPGSPHNNQFAAATSKWMECF